MPEFPGTRCPVTETLSKQQQTQSPAFVLPAGNRRSLCTRTPPWTRALEGDDVRLSKTLLSSDILKMGLLVLFSFAELVGFFVHLFYEKVSVHASDSAQQTALVIHYSWMCQRWLVTCVVLVSSPPGNNLNKWHQQCHLSGAQHGGNWAVTQTAQWIHSSDRIKTISLNFPWIHIKIKG